jgi:hypothetical protein
MQDAGTKFNTALDALALMTLMNGEQADGSCSAATIGVRSIANGFTYRDYKHITKRMERMGRRDMIMIAGEDASVDIELLPEFLGGNYQTRIVNIGNQSRTQELITHGIIPDKKVMFVDKKAALLKLTYQGMSIETERYARTDISAAYVRCSTGFATNGFPTWIDPTTVEKSYFGKRGNV